MTIGVHRPLMGASVWCPKDCRNGVTFRFPEYRPVYWPERSCTIHVLTEEQLYDLGQAAYRKYQASTPYLWFDSWEGDPR